MIFGFKDSLRQAVEAASGGLATVMYTPKGQPLFMRRITPFRLEDLAPDGSLGTGWHPAFPDGREFWVSIYRICVADGEPISVPGVAPSMGGTPIWLSLPMPPGMRLMSVLEYAALALSGTKILGDVLRGNDARGANATYSWETGVRVDGLPPRTPSGNGITLTGSGPVTWRHDHTPWGVELLGNLDLLLVGARFKLGQIQIHPEGLPLGIDTPDAMWFAVDTGGNLVAANTTAPTLGYNQSGKISTERTPNIDFPLSFANITGDGVTVPPILKALGFAPSLYTRGNGFLGHGTNTYLALYAGGRGDLAPAAPGTLRGGSANFALGSALVVYRE